MTDTLTEYAELSPMRTRVALSDYTTLRIGGEAPLFFEPAKPEHLVSLLSRLQKDDMPWRMLGAGANVLIPDDGVKGAVIQTGGMRRAFREDECLRCWPGVTLPQLVNIGRELGLAGLEHLAGVPGHIGGAIALNAGSTDWGIWDVVREVTLWDPSDDTLQAYTPEQIQPEYRNGNLGDRVLIEALLELEVSTPAVVKQRFEDVVRRKNASQPVAMSSAGCAFRNPEGDSAGRLIDACGLKGTHMGAAVISERHANFIVNEGGATSADVLALLELIEQTVFEKEGVRLHREIIVW